MINALEPQLTEEVAAVAGKCAGCTPAVTAWHPPDSRREILLRVTHAPECTVAPAAAAEYRVDLYEFLTGRPRMLGSLLMIRDIPDKIRVRRVHDITGRLTAVITLPRWRAA